MITVTGTKNGQQYTFRCISASDAHERARTLRHQRFSNIVIKGA